MLSRLSGLPSKLNIGVQRESELSPRGLREREREKEREEREEAIDRFSLGLHRVLQ